MSLIEVASNGASCPATTDVGGIAKEAQDERSIPSWSSGKFDDLIVEAVFDKLKLCPEFLSALE